VQLRVQPRLRCAAANCVAVVERKCMLSLQPVRCCRLHTNGAGCVSGVTLSTSTLAGGKILLNKARLHLKRGRRYGLCGHNGAGKVCVPPALPHMSAVRMLCMPACWSLFPLNASAAVHCLLQA
jgi:hypothetical protein